jgi:hypothetical protein
MLDMTTLLRVTDLDYHEDGSLKKTRFCAMLNRNIIDSIIFAETARQDTSNEVNLLNRGVALVMTPRNKFLSMCFR